MPSVIPRRRCASVSLLADNVTLPEAPNPDRLKLEALDRIEKLLREIVRLLDESGRNMN
jgi:hypothetical protein